jgi:hypothetical protein
MRFKWFFQTILENKKQAVDILNKYFPDTKDVNNEQLRQQLLDLDTTGSKGNIKDIINLYQASGNDFDLLRTYIKKFDELKAKNKIKDLKLTAEELDGGNYFIKFTEKIDGLNRSNTKIQKVKSGDISEADAIVNNDDLTIYKGDSQHKCVTYGKGYSFCISRAAGGNMFSNYRLDKESTFYFVYFKNVPKSDPNHILVIDATNDGFEITNELNATRRTTWNAIVSEFPILNNYRSIFVNKPMDTAERQIYDNITYFIRRPTPEKFASFNIESKIAILKSGISIQDDVFDILSSELINEYIGVGPNITDYQAKKLTESQKNRYKTVRLATIPQLIESNNYEYNILDEEAHRKILKEKATKYKGGDFKIINYYGEKLPDLTEMIITGNFYCNHNKLTSLQGAPREVVKNFACHNNKLTSLEGAPREVGGGFICSGNNLTSLEGAPREVGGDFHCSGNNLTSLEGAPRYVGGYFHCSRNNLTSLEGAPRKVGGDFDCNSNKLTSLEGAPDKVGGNFQCSSNNLTSLEGAPLEVGKGFYCTRNNLTSLEGAPEQIGGRLISDFR